MMLRFVGVSVPAACGPARLVYSSEYFAGEFNIGKSGSKFQDSKRLSCTRTSVYAALGICATLLYHDRSQSY